MSQLYLYKNIMEIVLIFWSVLLILWTILLCLGSLDYRRKHSHLYQEQLKWLARAERQNRERLESERN